MKQINQVVCVRPGILEHQKSNYPKRKSGEALLKIERIGICGTDLHAYGGNQPFFTYPRILGHELAARVLEVDTNNQNIKVGDWVAVMPYLSCGTCATCISGKTNCCQHMQVFGVHVDGGMREVVSLPTDFLLPVEGLSPEAVTLIEPLAIGQHALMRANVSETDSVVVMGCGPIGIGLIKLAAHLGAQVIALDSNADRIAYAKNKLDVSQVYEVGVDNLAQCKALFDGNLATVVFDATGNQQAMETGHQFMRHGGQYVLVGLYKGDLRFSHPVIHTKETSLLCSRNATREDFLAVISYLKSESFPVAEYITHRIPFDHVPEEMKHLTQPAQGVLKAMIHF